MGPETAGKRIGVGLRLAAKAVQRATAPEAPSPSKPENPHTAARESYIHPDSLAAKVRSATHAAGKAPTFLQGVGQGAKRFAKATWGPMAHTGSVLSLEITGLFFGLFAVFFGQNVYKMRHDYRSGPEHTHFVVYSAFTLIFAWFTFSNFYQARKKEKRNRARSTSQTSSR